MKFQRFVIITGISASIWTAAAAPESSLNSNSAPVEKSLETLVDELSNDRYKIREEASQKLWSMGNRALAELEKAAAGKDPERAYRARELVRKIQLRVTPETDSGVRALIERYQKATPNEKSALLQQLNGKRAYWQMLRLYDSETDPNILDRMEDEMLYAAVTAAREELLQGNANEARELLEMAPKNAAGRLALADFHRVQGTLEAELKHAKTQEWPKSAAWQLALYRAAGNIEAARDAAIAAQEPEIAATMSALLGDPLPWLEIKKGDSDFSEGEDDIAKTYSKLAVARWQGKPVRQADLKPLIDVVNSRSPYASRNAMGALFLLGERGVAEKESKPSLDAFLYYGATERVPEALKAIGLDLEETDYSAWVAQQMKRYIEDDVAAEEEDDEEKADVKLSASAKLVALVSFFEERGMHDEFKVAFLKPLEDLAKADQDKFIKFLNLTLVGIPGQTASAPACTRIAVAAWAGDDAQRWKIAADSLFSDYERISQMWDWLAELAPEALHAQRFDGVMALIFGVGDHSSELSEKWTSLAWKKVEEAVPEKRLALLERLLSFFLLRDSEVGFYSSNSAFALKIWERFPEDSAKIYPLQTHLYDLSLVGRWNDAADLILSEIEKSKKAGQRFGLVWHAMAAGSLRRAGRVEEASVQDRLIEKLALGNDAAEIAAGYAYAYDYQRAADWQAKAVIQNDPKSEQLGEILEEYVIGLKNQGNWSVVASVSEVSAKLHLLSPGNMKDLGRLGIRFQADFARAMTLVKKDRAAAVAQLGKCYQMYPSDGALADDFFPALRKAGLMKEHDAWFEESWTRMLAICEKFPNSDKSLNTTAWLASRAQRNLDEAEKLEMRAMELAPNHAAYLDTMAEIHFAKGNRAKAVEFSTRALNFHPSEPMMRRQHARFRTEPLPR
jgi:hypothetical protein